MEIRRIDPELIPPTVASDRGSRTNPDRHTRDDHTEKEHKRKPSPNEESVESEELAPGTMTYNPEGKLLEPDLPAGDAHGIDFRA